MKSQPKTESSADKLWRHGFYALGAMFLVAFAVVLFIQNGAAFLLLIGAALAFMASRLPDITKFKLTTGGLETELREALSEAQATVSQLQFLAAENAKYTLHLMQSEGRWGGGDPRIKKQMRAQIISTLRQLGLSDSEVSQVTDVEVPWIQFDYAWWVVKDIVQTQAQTTRWNEFFRSAERKKGVGHEPSPAELRNFLTEMEMMTPEIEERLKDYAHFVEHKTHRRPEAWEQRFAG